MTKLSYETLNDFSKSYGNTFYLINSKLFRSNYIEMLEAFRKYYEDTHIAYSYKTNYLPKLCEEVDSLGGCAEVVSEMELWLALKLGVDPEKIYYNGPYKKFDYVEQFMLLDGNLNIDSLYEVDFIEEISKKYPEKNFKVGIRCNVNIDSERVSRFGIDTESGLLFSVIEKLESLPNVTVAGLHCHLPFRTLDSYRDRMKKVKEILSQLHDHNLDYISLGGGYMGKIEKTLAKEFKLSPPSFNDYAEVVAGEFAGWFADRAIKPKLIIEPGTALVANVMQLVTRVVDIKHIRDRYIATLSGSTHNMNPGVKGINRPIEVLKNETLHICYEDLSMAGYTCIESDYLFEGYNGELAVGDFVVFNNVGSYSLVMKPPFILPDIAVLDIANTQPEQLNKIQSFEDVFHRYF